MITTIAERFSSDRSDRSDHMETSLKTLELVISRCCFAEDGTEMYCM